MSATRPSTAAIAWCALLRGTVGERRRRIFPQPPIYPSVLIHARRSACALATWRGPTNGDVQTVVPEII